MLMRLFSCVAVSLCFFLLCDIPQPPPGPDEAAISLFLTSSDGSISDSTVTITDTAGNVGTISIVMYLAMHIDSVFINVTIGDQTVKTYSLNPLENRIDTVEFPFLLANPGIYTVIVTGFVESLPNLVAKGTIKIIGRSSDTTNTKPVLNVPASQVVVVDETMILELSATDPDDGQTVTISALEIPAGSIFSSDTFKWTPTIADTGRDTLIFIATDNGLPDALSDTDSVIVIVSATAENRAPQWNPKKIQKIAAPGVFFMVASGTYCTDPDDDSLTFFLIQEPPAGDTITGSAYSFTPSESDTGRLIIHIIARDPSGLADTLTLELTVSNNPSDVIAPVFQRISPVNDSVVISSPDIQVTVSCRDESGIDSVKCFSGTTAFDVVKSGDSTYSATVTGLQAALWNTVTFIATDASAARNPCTLLVHLKYDTAAPDNVSPVMTFRSPSKDTVIAADSFEVRVTCVDDSGISLVNGYSDTTAFTLNKSASVANLWTGMVKGIAEGRYTTIKIVAADSSFAENRNSISVRIKFDNDKTGPAIVLVNPEKDSVTTTTSNCTIKLQCTDASGVYSVDGASGEETFGGIRDTGSQWEIRITGLEANEVTAVVITAVDSSLEANKTLDTVYITSEIIDGYTITFDKNDDAATGAMAKLTVNNGDTVELPANGFAKDGWTFDGWAISPTGAVTYEDEADFTMGTADLTLYAKWSANVYSVSFDKNDAGATGSMAAQSLSAGSFASLAANGFEKDGAVFAGWAASPAGAVVYADKAVYTMGTGDDTLYAKWSANIYSIVFDKNDAEAIGTMPSQSVASGTAVPLTANTYIKTGWTFTGWATSAAGAIAYADESSYTMGTENDTLFAKWSQDVLKITFDKNDADATGTMTAQSVSSGDVVPLKTNGYSKPGYTFTGWAASPTGTVAYTNGGNFTMGTADVTLYAKWKISSYQLSVSAASGGAITVPGSSPVAVTHGTATTVTATADAGYTFSGWKVTAGRATIADSADASTTVTLTSGDAAVTANFTLNTYALSVSAGTGGSISTPASSPVTVNYNAATAITAAASTGYDFSGWKVTAGSATITDASAASTTVKLTSGNATVTANFKLKTYSLTVAAGTGGTITVPASSLVTVNHNAATTITAAASTGYTFSGWTVTTGTATIASASSASTTVKLTSGNATVTANFKLNTYSLTVAANTGGSITVPSSSPVTVNHNAATTITAKASSGYTFSKWTVTTGTATITSASSASTTVKLTSGNATVTASFTIVPVAVATWTLSGTINSGTAFAVTSTVTDVTASSLSKSSALTETNFANAFVADDWPSGSLTTTKYFQFGVTAASGHQLVYNSVRFSIYNNMSGSTSWAIRSSVDSYASNLASGSSSSITAGGAAVNADVSSLGTRSGTVTFRVYTYNNSGSSYPLQRGFRGSAASGTDLKVWAGVK